MEKKSRTVNFHANGTIVRLNRVLIESMFLQVFHRITICLLLDPGHRSEAIKSLFDEFDSLRSMVLYGDLNHKVNVSDKNY